MPGVDRYMSKINSLFIIGATLLGATAIAGAEPRVTVTPSSIHPGEAVLVSVSNVTEAPSGKAGGQALGFFTARTGYQAVFAVPLGINEDHVMIEIGGGVKPLSIPVLAKKFAETKIVVEDEYADPPAEERDGIVADNKAIGDTYGKGSDGAQFTRAFVRPGGGITSRFGEWRTFQDGHRAQHLGLDIAAREGARVPAIDDGTVTLVRDTFLAGTVVVIDHGAGISSLYFHLSKPTVAVGDHVARGERIGLAGHTGRTTGPHIHLSVHVPGGMVDPESFVKLPFAPASRGTASTASR